MFDLKIERCETAEDRALALAWIKQQPGHQHYVGCGNSVLAVVKQNGKIVATFELFTAAMLSTVFAVENNGKTTFRAAEAIFHAAEGLNVRPIIECNADSPLLPYIEKVGNEIFHNTRFFVR